MTPQLEAAIKEVEAVAERRRKEAAAAEQASARADVRSINWLDAAVARKNDWEQKRIEALRVGNKDRAEYWEGRRDGVNEVLMLHDLAASSG